MCGICGICLDDGGLVPRVNLEAMNDSIAHRGPDGSGFYTAPGVGLGHRRLSIIDLQTGDQPIYNEDRSVAIVFNGEIYNYKELQPELVSLGHRLATQSDTEVIVHLYEEFGVDCLQRLNGMFAFAIWDAGRRRLFAARDRMGEKPLYYMRLKDRLLFASELKAILTCPGVGRELNIRALDDYLAYGYVPAPETIFKDIHKLRAGEYLVYENGDLIVRSYWSLEPTVGPERTEDSYLEELRSLLDDSVRIRLRSDVPVGAFLSGGLDSNTIVAIASGLLDRPIETFSVGFKFSEFNELPLARLTADRYKTNHHEIIVDDTDVSIVEKLAAHFDEPFADASMVPTYYISREASKYVKVCLSGDAGDEIFAGYTHYRDALAYAQVDRLPQPFRQAVFGTVAGSLPSRTPGVGLMRRIAADGAVRYQQQLGVFDGAERRRLFRPELASAVRDADLFEGLVHRGADLLTQCQLIDQQTYLPDDVLVKVDRAAMKNALEVRVPFLDHRVVQLANSLPSHLKIRGTTQKYILRKLAADLLPAAILSGEKRGFGIPIKHWFRSELKHAARDLLLSSASHVGDFVQRSAMERLLSAHERGGRDFSDRIWSLVVLEQWLRTVGRDVPVR